MISLIDELNHKQFTDQISQGAKASFAIAVVYGIAVGIILGLNNSPILHSHTQFLISPLPIFILFTAISSYIVYLRKKEFGILVKNTYEKIKEKISLKIDFEDFVILNKVLINRIKKGFASPGLNFMESREIYGSENGRFLIIGEKEIGSGGFKQVFVAVDLLSRQFFAAKKTNHLGETIKQKIANERSIEQQLASYSSFKKPAFVFLENGEYILEIEELYDGDLNKLINAKHILLLKKKMKSLKV